MIKSFGDKESEKIWMGVRSRKLPNEIQHVARRKLRMLNSASSLVDLRIPPANRLERLKGELEAFYSIRVNDQWRVIFYWSGTDAYEVAIVDYH